MTQRELYKLIEGLASRQFAGEIDLLSELVREIVEHTDIMITGARIWRISDTADAYTLLYQCGAIEKLPEHYTLMIDENPVFSRIAQAKTVLEYEKDSVLKGVGIRQYSAIAVGETIRRRDGMFPTYILAFNGPQMNRRFFDTISIIAVGVSMRLRELFRDKEDRQIQRDLRQAWEIQRGLLPDHQANFHDYDVYGISIPDREVGGDYFDYLYPAGDYEERLGIVISDAASKGLPAAIQALFVSGALRMGSGFSTKISALISRLNNLIYETFPFERFVTLFYCELLSSENGLVLYANAGHCNPLHYHHRNQRFTSLETTGGALGIAENQRFRIENINMEMGDILVMFTDGIIEAQDKDGNLYNAESLKAIIRSHAQLPAREIAYMIVEDVQHFTVGAKYNDDKTLIVIKRTAAPYQLNEDEEDALDL